MCDLQAKLVAWLDRELTPEQATAVDRHVDACHECRRLVATYGRVSQTFHAYCDGVMAAKAPRHTPWVPVLAGTLIAATAVCVGLLGMRVVPPAVVAPTIPVASAPLPGPPPPVAEPVLHQPAIRRRHPAPHIQELARQEQPIDAAIQIAIPAEAIFPPGSVPDGINFIADLRIAPDGSVKQVSLRQ